MFAYHRAMTHDVVRPSCDVTRRRTTTWINCWLIAQCSCDVAGRKILSKGISYDDVRCRTMGITMTCVVVWLHLHHILLSIIVDHRTFWPSWAIIDQRTLCGPKALIIGLIRKNRMEAMHSVVFTCTNVIMSSKCAVLLWLYSVVLDEFCYSVYALMPVPYSSMPSVLAV